MSLRDELRRIYENTGALTPQSVVDIARPKGSPLHSHFEWNDKVAGEKYRLSQAGELIRSVRLERGDGREKFGSLREFHSIRAPGVDDEGPTNAYKPLDEIMRNPIETELLRRQMETDWRALKARYEMFGDFRAFVLEELGVAS